MKRYLEIWDILKPFSTFLLSSCFGCLGLINFSLGTVFNTLFSLLKFKCYRLCLAFFVESWFLSFHLIDVFSCNFSETSSFFKMFNKAKTAFSDQKKIFPSLNLCKLNWICEIKWEYVPSISYYAYQLQPRFWVLCIFSCSCHSDQEIWYFGNSFWNMWHKLLFIILVLLFELKFHLSLLIKELLKYLLTFLKINLQDVIEDAGLNWYLKLWSLRWLLSDWKELTHSLEEVFFAYPKIRVEFLSFFLLRVKDNKILIFIIILRSFVSRNKLLKFFCSQCSISTGKGLFF
jgi:hypothetical protein